MNTLRLLSVSLVTCALVGSSATCVAQAGWSPLVLEGRTGTTLLSLPGDNQNKVFLFGGESEGRMLGDSWEYTVGGNYVPIAQQQQQEQTGPSARSGHAAAQFANFAGSVMVFGGMTVDGLSNETWTFDGNCWDTQDPPTVPPARQGHILISTGIDEMLMYGGIGVNGTLLEDTWRWNGSDWVALFPANTPGPRANHRAAPGQGIFGGPQAIVFGGKDPNGFRTDTWGWDGSNWVQLQDDASGPAVFEDSFGLTQDGQLFGTSPSGWTLWQWDGVGQVWNTVTSGPATDPVNRRRPNATISDTLYFSLDDAIVTGGTLFDAPPDLDVPLTDTWQFIAGSWNQTEAGSPAPRFGAGFAFDTEYNEVVILAGALDNDNLDDSWTFDGTDWTEQVSGLSGPGPRIPNMAYDPVLQRTLMIGGQQDGDVLGPTRMQRAWDGDTDSWSQLNSTSDTILLFGTTPADVFDLVGASMVYDVARQRMVLTGGEFRIAGATKGTPSAVTWELDATTNHWTGTPLLVRPQVGLTRFHITFDEDRQKVVAVDDLGIWEWNGSLWSFSGSDAFPGPGSLAFDTILASLFLSNPSGTFQLGASNNTWVQRSSSQIEGAMYFNPAIGQLISAEDSDRVEAFDALSAGTYFSYGTGCPAAFGTPEISLVASPTPGTNYVAIVEPYPPGTLGMMWLGGSNQTWLTTGLPLPLDLSPIGMTGCAMLSSWEAETGLNTTGEWFLPIPNGPAFVNTSVFHQAVLEAPGANPLGIVVSNAVEFVVGTQLP